MLSNRSEPPSILTRLVPALTALLAGFALAQDIVFTNINVFDGEELLQEQTVIVEDGVITGLGQQAAIPEDVEVIDGAGHTLLPGLIDAHQHVFTPDSLHQSLIFGTTTVLDMFTDPAFAQQMREGQQAGEASDRADMYSAGMLATAPEGHGTQFGLPVEGLTSSDEAADWVARRIEEGSDYIKVVLETGAEMAFELPTLNPETARAVIEAANEQ